MGSQRVTLYVRPRLSDGSHPYLPPVFGGNRRIKEGYALVDGQPQHFKNAVYYLRYVKAGKRQWVLVGPDASKALTEQYRVTKLLESVAAGNELPASEQPEPTSPLLSKATEKYLTRSVNRGQDKSTQDNYCTTLEQFKEQIGDVRLHTVTADDVLAYGAWMRGEDYSEHTIRRRLKYIKTVFRHFGFPDVLPYKQLPRPVDKTPDAYSEDELGRLFAACTDDERLAFEFFLSSGARRSETAYATWRDINFDAGEFTVRDKPRLGFSPKDRAERTVPLPDALVEALRERRKQHPDSLYIFGGGQRPNMNMLHMLKRIAFHAGLNCGECLDKKARSCKDHPCCHLWTLHKFRRSYATLQHERGGVSANTLKDLLGHSDLKTTIRYLAAAKNTTKLRSQSNATFGDLLGGPRVERTSATEVTATC